MMPMIEKAFLETTACIDLMFNAHAKLRQRTKDFKLLETSNYVKMEIKKGYINHLIYLHNILADTESFAGTLKAVNGLHHNGHKRKLMAILKQLEVIFRGEIFHKPLREIDEKDTNIDSLICKKARNILYTKIKKFKNGIEKLAQNVTNEMGCYRDIEPPYIRNDRFHNDNKECIKSIMTCEIFTFFKKGEDEFNKMHKALRNIPEKDDETEKRAKSLKELLKKTELERSFSNAQKVDAKHCWACSDAILVATSPRDALLITSNQKHFEPLTASVGKSSEYYNPKE
jgi:hypothetical protein